MTSNISTEQVEGDLSSSEAGIFKINHSKWPSYSGYQPLNKDKREIRLLSIECSPANVDITCTLKQFPLLEAKPFYALSYVWGAKGGSRSILLNNQCIRIRENLWTFLRTLCDTVQANIKVWVDCICIDQQNVAERNFEVSMMGDIFGSADSVYAWLGTSTTESEAAFSYVRKAKTLRASGMPYGQIEEGHVEGLTGLKDVISRHYWTRLWIIQEVVLAERLWIFCGSQYVNWEDLQLALIGNKVRYVLNQDIKCQQNAKIIQYFKRTREERVRSSISDLVHRFREANCQDARDKIYGLLSLAEQSSKSTISINYAKPLLQVLLETFSCWASDAIVPVDFAYSQQDSRVSSCAFPAVSFFQELSLLFDDAALESFCKDESIHKMVSETVVLRGDPEQTFCFSQTIAIADTSKPQVLACSPASITAAGISSLMSCFVTLEEPILTPMRSLIYTTAVPLAGDVVLNLGETILLMRSTTSNPENRHAIVGRGIRLPYKTNGILYDPCHFASQLLADSSYTLINTDDTPIPNTTTNTTNPSAQPTRPRTNRKEFRIRLNAAAVAESMRIQKLHKLKFSPNSNGDFWTWDVFNFGLQHQLLDMCPRCHTVYTGHDKEAAQHHDVDLQCRCVWTHGASEIQSP